MHHEELNRSAATDGQAAGAVKPRGWLRALARRLKVEMPCPACARPAGSDETCAACVRHRIDMAAW